MSNLKSNVNEKEISNSNFLVLEWIKWLSYEPQFEKDKILDLKVKVDKYFSPGYIVELEKYKKRITILPLLKKFYNGKCSCDEFMQAFDFLMNECILSLMLEKLTSQEFVEAKQVLEQISIEELREKRRIEKMLENYEALSMVESYVLHVISQINLDRNQEEIREEIDSYIRQRNFYRK